MGDIRTSGMGGTPFGDTASRPSSAQVGQTYYNGQLGYLEIYTVSGWIPATGANDLNINLTGINTTVTFSQTYASGSYSVVSLANDTTLDIYAYASDGSLAGYTNTKSFIATQRFNKMVILGGSVGDVLSFSYKTTYTTSLSTTDVTAGPYITSVSPSSMPNKNDTVTVTGGNFATDVAITFTGSGYSATPAKSIVRSSSTSLIVTRPDNLPVSVSPYTITATNPSVTNQPTGSNSHILSNSITAGTNPVWNTAASQLVGIGNAYSLSLSASDSENSTETYTYVSGTLPTGLSFSNGVISGTATTAQTTTYTVRATDAGGNYVDRTFTFSSGYDGSSAASAATNAIAIKNFTGTTTDGLYWIKNSNINGGAAFQVYCDMNTAGGGWILLLTSLGYSEAGGGGWTNSNTHLRNSSSPSPQTSYSIIDWGDYLKSSASGFKYMIGAAASGYDRTAWTSYGGIITANGNYSFTTTNPNQTNLTADQWFGGQSGFSDSSGIGGHFPWFSNQNYNGQANSGIYTTYPGSGSWWGALVEADNGGYNAGPFQSGGLQSPARTWLWVK